MIYCSPGFRKMWVETAREFLCEYDPEYKKRWYKIIKRRQYKRKWYSNNKERLAVVRKTKRIAKKGENEK
jgi:hypothetical protein